jgi:hypothetical protein
MDLAQLKKITNQGVVAPVGLALPDLAGLVHAG